MCDFRTEWRETVSVTHSPSRNTFVWKAMGMGAMARHESESLLLARSRERESCNAHVDGCVPRRMCSWGSSRWYRAGLWDHHVRTERSARCRKVDMIETQLGAADSGGLGKMWSMAGSETDHCTTALRSPNSACIHPWPCTAAGEVMTSLPYSGRLALSWRCCVRYRSLPCLSRQ